MAPPDLDKARSRLIAAVKRIHAGLRLERDRILQGSANAPKLLPGTEHEIVDLTNVPGNDLDDYAYECARLQDVAREVNRVFGNPPEIIEALADFEAAVPNLRAARNPLTHPSNDARLDDVGWFSALARFLPNGAVEYLVDPRYSHHAAAETLAEAFGDFSEQGLRRWSGTMSNSSEHRVSCLDQ